jgi:hypothetical protein
MGITPTTAYPNTPLNGLSDPLSLDLLHVQHAYPEFVPTVTIRWTEL